MTQPQYLPQNATVDSLAGQPADTAQVVLPADPAAEAHTSLFVSDSLGNVRIDADDLLHAPYSDSLIAHSGALLPRETGVEGQPLPYHLRNDVYVTSILLLSFFFIVWIVTRSGRYLGERLQDFFRQEKRRDKFTEDVEARRRGTAFFLFQTSFVLSLLAFDYFQDRMPSLVEQSSPYLLLTGFAGVSLVYYLLKMLLYRFVNDVFFTPTVIRRWTDAYLLYILATGVLLFPVALLVVFFDLSPTNAFYACTIVVILCKIMLFLKSFLIFSEVRLSFIHNILYFCTLEILPLLFWWEAILFVTRNISSII